MVYKAPSCKYHCESMVIEITMTLQYNFFFQLRVDQLNETAERAKLFVDVMYLLHSQS